MRLVVVVRMFEYHDVMIVATVESPRVTVTTRTAAGSFVDSGVYPSQLSDYNSSPLAFVQLEAQISSLSAIMQESLKDCGVGRRGRIGGGGVIYGEPVSVVWGLGFASNAVFQKTGF